MANEATLLVETELPQNFTCAYASGIEKGACVKLSDPNTVATTVAADTGPACGGIAKGEKLQSGSALFLSVFRGGRFKVTATTDAVTVNDSLTISGANLFRPTISSDNNNTWGIALESATSGQTFKMELRPGCSNMAQ